MWKRPVLGDCPKLINENILYFTLHMRSAACKNLCVNKDIAEWRIFLIDLGFTDNLFDFL